MMNINDLPNELLVKIFTNIESLAQVFRIQIVCQKWKAISKLTLEAKRSLCICHQNLDLSPYGSLTFLKDHFDKRNTLWFNTPTKSTINLIMEKMPRIESLELCKLFHDDEDLMTFLTCWQEQLSQLTIICTRRYMPLSYEKQLSLMVRQYKLRHLYLLGTAMSSELMSNLMPLQTIFHFNEKNGIDYFPFDSYSWLSAVDRVGDQIENIHFINPGLKSKVLERTLPNLKRLSINVDMLENVKLLCDHYPSLTHLDLILYDTECSFMQMLPSLVHLTVLTNLRIATPVRFLRYYDVLDQRQTVFPFYKVTTRNFKRRLSQLPNVTNLHLSIELKLIRMQFLEHIFPNVVELTFNGPIFRCECHLPVYGLCRRCSVAILNRLLGIRSLKKLYSNATLLFNRNLPDIPIPDTVLDSLFYTNENMPTFDIYEAL